MREVGAGEPGKDRSDAGVRRRGGQRIDTVRRADWDKALGVNLKSVLLGSTIVLGDEACFCQFEGPSEEAVAEANRTAGLSFDRIVPAVTVRPTKGEIR